MNKKTVELHLLQSFPPSCVNRDGNNSPKDCIFGGIRRARISSQCLKRAIRQSDIFAETIGEAIATRSKQMRDHKLIPYLLRQGLGQDEAEKAADAFRAQIAANDKKKPESTNVGLYFGDDELFALLDAHRNGDSKWIKAATKKSADVALFGRMLAEATELNVDAASQVAHAISTHQLSQDIDYWTAADDLKGEEDDAGAGMLGQAEFNASIFYRYACVSLNQLRSNLKDEEMVKRTVEAFLLASFDAVPTGKLSGHAHFTRPYLALAVVREKGMPLNLCNAFVKPATSKKLGLDEDSAEKLLAHLQSSRRMASLDVATYILAHQFSRDDFATEDVVSVPGYGELVKKVLESL